MMRAAATLAAVPDVPCPMPPDAPYLIRVIPDATTFPVIPDATTFPVVPDARKRDPEPPRAT